MGGLFSKPKAPPTPAPTIIYRDRVRSETAKVDTKLDAAKKSKAGTGRASLSTTEAGLKPTTAEKEAKRKRTKVSGRYGRRSSFSGSETGLKTGLG